MSLAEYFHVGIIVPDIHAARARFTDLLGVEWGPVMENEIEIRAQEVAFEFALQAITCPGTQLAAHFYTVRGTKLGTQARRDQVEGRFVHGRTLQCVHRAFVGVAVLLQPTLDQNCHGGLATRGWT